MTRRRDLLIGLACVAASGAAWALTPRRRYSLLGETRLAEITPSSFGGWTSTDVSSLVAPAAEGSLAARIYDQTLERVYEHPATDVQIMMLFAHGDTQTNKLQLHRPEECYPAFGFQISSNQAATIRLAGAVTLPCRRLVADTPGRRENIVYWTRLGDFLPVDGAEQRLDRVKTALGGVVADGLLARLSIVAAEPATAFAAIDSFIPELIRSISSPARPAIIGAQRARALAAGGF